MIIKKLVFLEDDVLDFEVYKTALKNLNVEISIFHETQFNEDFYEKYDQKHSLVFIDLRMGQTNGRDLFLKYLKDRNYISYILSSSDNPNDIEKCKGIGLAGYLQKKNGIESIYEQIVATLKFSEINLLLKLA